MAYQAVMFDLDGTLANTLDDITSAANSVLTQLGRKTVTPDEAKFMIGSGAAWLFQQALGPDSGHLVPQAVELMEAYYRKHGQVHTRPYDGIPEVLDAIVARKLKLVVFSNKLDGAVQQTMVTKFTQWKFDVVLGAKEGNPLKPDPTAALGICKQLNIAPKDWLYVGDTAIDMHTANNAGFFGVGVLWGFRDEKELRESGAKAIIAHPRELLLFL